MKMRCIMSLAATLCCSGLAASVQAAENCVDASLSPVTVGTTTGNFTGSTNDGPTGCGGTANLTQWFEFIPVNTGKYTISTCGSAQVDTVLGITLSSALCTGAATYIQCSDDACGFGSQITPTLTAGIAYRLRVSTFGGITGAGLFALTIIQEGAAPPAGDDCASPVVAVGGSNPGSLVGATNSFNANSCGGTVDLNDVYYSFTAAVAGTARFSLCSGDFDAVLSLHTACPVPPSTTNQIASACATSGNLPITGCTTGRGATLTRAMTLGETVIIRIAGASDATGTGSPFVGFGGYDLVVSPPVPQGSCCIGSCCAVTGQASCTGTWTIGGVCTPNTCPAPANDACANAVALTLNTPATGDNCNATSTNDGPAATCQASGGKGVWFTFTPASTGYYRISSCGSNQDTILSVFTTDCTTFAAVSGGCDDDTCDGITPPGSGNASDIRFVQLQASTLYHIRLSSFGATPSGNTYTITVSDAVAGACCNATTGACTVVATAATCASGSTYQGNGTLCNPNSCPQPTGACCTPDGGCSTLTGAACTTAGGLFQGNASVCSGLVCPVAVGSCCNNTTGVCTYILGTSTCSGGTFTSGGFCSPNSCPQPGACCVAGCCSVTLQSACTGTWGPANSTCTPGLCGTPVNNECAGATSVAVGANLGTNCGATTSFVVTPETQCGGTSGAGGARDVFHIFTPAQSANYTINTCGTPGFDSTLALYNSCPVNGLTPPVACNDDTAGTCAISGLRSEIPNQLLIAGNSYIVRVAAWGGGTAEGPYVLNITQGAAAGACCTGTTCAISLGFNCPPANYQGDFTACGPNTCDPLGSCCAVDGTCTEVAQSLCTGTFTLAGTCTPNTCPQPTGACCCGSSCTITLPAACTGTNQSFAGPGTTCVPFSNTVPCCRGDFNKVGAVSVQDIFDFLAGYFAGDSCADTNDSTGISVQDIFDFLAAYFGGC